MNSIFTFIFECLRDLFNFLDFNLPGTSLTYIEFFVLAIIIPFIIKLVKGSVSNVGEDVLFTGLGSASSISNYASLSYKNYELDKSQKPVLIYSDRHPIKAKINIRKY